VLVKRGHEQNRRREKHRTRHRDASHHVMPGGVVCVQARSAAGLFLISPVITSRRLLRSIERPPIFTQPHPERSKELATAIVLLQVLELLGSIPLCSCS